jgi:ferric-dicitrate binding protein FerR (iron transport regulator)
MDRELLYNFFKGNATLEEGMKIKAWVEASEENERTFYKERELFNTLLLHNPLPEKKSSVFKLSIFKKIKSDGLKIAVVVILTLAFSYLYQGYKNRRADVIMSTISVPEGQRTHLTLPDGTTVWLNARTTIQYPSSFNKKKRVVILQGEAYFDVKRSEDKPFVVQTSVCDVEVLGTKFNVNAYPELKKFEATLMHGSVKVIPKANPSQVVILKPEHKLSLENGKLNITRVENFDPYRWKEGLICFTDESFLNIMKDFEKYYGVKIVMENEKVGESHFTGKFRLSDGIDYALRILQGNLKFQYEKDNEKQIIHIR